MLCNLVDFSVLFVVFDYDIVMYVQYAECVLSPMK